VWYFFELQNKSFSEPQNQDKLTGSGDERICRINLTVEKRMISLKIENAGSSVMNPAFSERLSFMQSLALACNRF
jgi:hypothetical protein